MKYFKIFVFDCVWGSLKLSLLLLSEYHDLVYVLPSCKTHMFYSCYSFLDFALIPTIFFQHFLTAIRSHQKIRGKHRNYMSSLQCECNTISHSYLDTFVHARR